MWSESGLSKVDYATQNGLSPQSFYGWFNKTKTAPQPATEFVEIKKRLNRSDKNPATNLKISLSGGLSVIVQNILKADPFNGSLYLFCNRRRILLKLLYWDSNGFCLWQLC